MTGHPVHENLQRAIDLAKFKGEPFVPFHASEVAGYPMAILNALPRPAKVGDNWLIHSVFPFQKDDAESRQQVIQTISDSVKHIDEKTDLTAGLTLADNGDVVVWTKAA